MNKLSNFFGKNSQPIMVRTMRSATTEGILHIYCLLSLKEALKGGLL